MAYPKVLHMTRFFSVLEALTLLIGVKNVLYRPKKENITCQIGFWANIKYYLFNFAIVPVLLCLCTTGSAISEFFLAANPDMPSKFYNTFIKYSNIGLHFQSIGPLG